MSEQAEAAYPEPKIHTQAQIVVTIGDVIKKWGWGPARTRKEQAAAWLRAQTIRGDTKISWTLKQKAAEVPWRDGANFYWTGPAPLGLEYAATALLGVGEWGRGR